MMQDGEGGNSETGEPWKATDPYSHTLAAEQFIPIDLPGHPAKSDGRPYDPITFSRFSIRNALVDRFRLLCGERFDDIDRQRKHDRGGIFAGYVVEGLQVAQLQGLRIFRHDLRRL